MLNLAALISYGCVKHETMRKTSKLTQCVSFNPLFITGEEFCIFQMTSDIEFSFIYTSVAVHEIELGECFCSVSHVQQISLILYNKILGPFFRNSIILFC